MEQDGDFSIGFGDSNVKEISAKLRPISWKLTQLQRKGTILSAAKIHLSGETLEIRKRRETLVQALTREPAGRLRSNSRKKRFDGVISPVKPSRKDWSLHGTIHNTNAAKTHEKPKREGTKTSVVTKSGAMQCRHQSLPYMQMPVDLDTTPTTRPKRSASLRSYIDWKFCYERVNGKSKK